MDAITSLLPCLYLDLSQAFLPSSVEVEPARYEKKVSLIKEQRGKTLMLFLFCQVDMQVFPQLHVELLEQPSLDLIESLL